MKFFQGFLACLAVLVLMGMVNRLNTKYDDSDKIADEFTNLYLFVVHPTFAILTSTPIPSNLKEGEIVLAKVGGVTNIFTRVQGSTWNVTLGRN